jgi:hypothetical protein
VAGLAVLLLLLLAQVLRLLPAPWAWEGEHSLQEQRQQVQQANFVLACMMHADRFRW